LRIVEFDDLPPSAEPSVHLLDMTAGWGPLGFAALKEIRELGYPAALLPAVQKALDEFSPELLFYVGGADPFCEDQLGGLSLTKNGLKERDRRVFKEARRRGIPVATALAGGYARQVEDTVRIHVNTIVAARDVASEFPMKTVSRA